LTEAVSELDAQLEDVEKRREAAREATSKSRQLAVKLRRRRSEADGSDERVREEFRQRLHSTIQEAQDSGTEGGNL
jgi:hypothetical protein